MAKLDGNERIVSFTNTFISLLQGTLKIQDSAYITVGEEIENIENYLTLQKFRYADKFESEIICEEKDLKPSQEHSFLQKKIPADPARNVALNKEGNCELAYTRLDISQFFSHEAAVWPCS